MSHEITEAARRDIRNILVDTLKSFGPHHLDTYEAIIDRGIEMVGDDPDRGGSIDRSIIAPDVRLFHLELAAGRRGASAHCLYYTTGMMSNGVVGTIILRVLHEGMEPRYKVVRSLNSHARLQAEMPQDEPAEDPFKIK
ncbi:type II toxin-antitoxin system RelE/ParE family toxin [Roseibium aggregatum]|uniref:Type II toxin-antitoxin system RelE/ParE family toxin n=1 Tax=Roseibium aggregatum TaxID=187304 RepID=A0A926NP91_9HYPH|nr:type II toxin-antitoxin system RelE/ParE family toxin [Roseibium aggregatum]MBD1544842.1 type II toxin-antitoxin system RelE/ParE family toxin [Roseibium aggregatum]